MRVNPGEILRFIEKNFESVSRIFRHYKEHSLIHFEVLHRICNENNIPLQKFLDYKILKRNGSNDFQFTGSYQYFFEFLLREFPLELPAAIEKYRLSITRIYSELSEGNTNRNIVIYQVNNLIQQVNELTEAIDNNLTRLDEEAKELKSNIKKISYVRKVEKASEWINYFIRPMNNILDNNHPDSITSIISEISRYSNKQRLFYPDISLRIHFDKLYTHLKSANKELLHQSYYLVRTLLPLIQKIRTESRILSGFIEFMKKPYESPLPEVFKVSDFNIYSRNPGLNAKEVMENWTSQKPVYFSEPAKYDLPWKFEKENYKRTLIDSLPVENFSQWTVSSLGQRQENISWEKFMSISTLLFEDDIAMEVDTEKSNTLSVSSENINLKIPKIKINAISRKS